MSTVSPEQLQNLYDMTRDLGTLLPGGEPGYLNYGLWDEVERTPPPRRAWEALLDHADIQAGSSVLNVGCGLGALEPVCISRCRPGRMIGVDLQLDHIAAAQANAEQAGLADAIEYVVADATDLPEQIPTDLDRVLALYTVEQFPSRMAFYEEAFRVLRPGGRLVLGEICLTRLPVTELEMECEQVHSEFWQIPQPKYLANDFSADLAEVGYLRVQVESVGSQVFKPFAQYLTTKMDVLGEMMADRLTDAESEQFQYLIRTQQIIADLDLYDFVYVTATRPENA